MSAKIKRFASMLFVLLLAFSMLVTTACGNKPVSNEDPKDDSTPVVDSDDTTIGEDTDDTTDESVEATDEVDASETDDETTETEADGTEDTTAAQDDATTTTGAGSDEKTTADESAVTTKKTTAKVDGATNKTTTKADGKTTTKKTSTKTTTKVNGKTTTTKKTTTKATTKASNVSTKVSSTTKGSTTTKTTTVTTTKSTTSRYKPTTTTSNQSVNDLMTKDAFVSSFEGWLDGANGYTMKANGSTKSGSLTVYKYAIDGEDADYCLHVYCNSNNMVTSVNLTLPRKDYEYMCPVLCYYVYNVFGFPEVDISDYLDRFEAMPNRNMYEKETFGVYTISCATPDEFFTFSVASKGYESSNTKQMLQKLTDAKCNCCIDDPDRILNYMTLTSNASSLGIRADMLDKALVSAGNQARLAKAMNKAKSGKDITVGFIGGSVTEGAYASDYKTTSYAGLTKTWWAKTFPQSNVNFVNAGIGGTSSLFGVHRVEEDLLKSNPDFVVIEFGVNDEVSDEHAEAYASLVRRVLSHESQPAVILLFVMNEGGSNAQENQQPIGKYYDLPMISYRDAVWPEVNTKSNIYGQYNWSDIAADWVHPTNKGHAIIAELICAYLQKTYENLSSISTSVPALPGPDRPYTYENAKFLNSKNTTPVSMGSFSVYNSGASTWKGSGSKPITFKVTGKRVILAIPTEFSTGLDVTIRIDGGQSFKLGSEMFHGGRFANFMILNSDKAAEHTIEITCNSGTLYLGGLFVS